MEEIATAASLDKKSKKIIFNTWNKCKLEAKNQSLQIPLDDFEDRVSCYTGIPKITLIQILDRNASVMYPKINRINFKTHMMILRCLSKFYKLKELPSLRLLLVKVNELLSTLKEQSFKDAEQFKEDLAMLGIEYRTVFNNTKLLMEDPKITFERHSYLDKITRFRQQQKSNFYYISERIIDKDCNFNNPWKQNGNTADICNGEYVLLHAVSKSGLANSLFCFSVTEDDFYKWVVDILLGSLFPASVVILDNSPLHGTLKSKSISMFDTKTDMKQWLRKHSIPFSDAMKKSQLYQLVKKHCGIEDIPRVDQVIKANGHQVLRLPTHFEDLSPIEHIWQNVKRNVHETGDNLHDDILSIFENISADLYELYEKDIVERENAMFLLDTKMDKVLDNFLTDLKNTAGSAQPTG